MGLLTILKKIKQKEKEMRILLLGLDNAGKTTLVRKLMGEDITTICPTLGFDIKTLECNGYKLNIWDVGGQKTIRSYWRNYFEETDGVIWVIDSADKRRLGDCAEELRTILQQEKLAGASLLIFANKQDLPGALPADEIAKILNLESESFKGHHNCVLACSAATGEGIEKGIDWIVEDICSRILLLN